MEDVIVSTETDTGSVVDRAVSPPSKPTDRIHRNHN